MRETPTILFCAGAVKAGTTWLWDYLESHPETYLRSIKELQYFDRLAAGNLQDAAFRMDREIADLDRVLDGGKAKWPGWVIRQIADRADYRQVILSAPAPTDAYLRYLTQGAIGKKLVADMTPEYGLLPVERMHDLSQIAGDVRWNFLMRDPVARLWSHVRMLVRRTKPAAEALDDRCRDTFEQVLSGKVPDVVLRSDYAAIHARLVAATRPDQRLVMFYEHLIRPEGVSRVTRFLGLADQPAKLDKRVHEGLAVDMPDPLRQRARDWLKPQYAFVAQGFGLPPEWEQFPGLRCEVA